MDLVFQHTNTTTPEAMQGIRPGQMPLANMLGDSKSLVTSAANAAGGM